MYGNRGRHIAVQGLLLLAFLSAGGSLMAGDLLGLASGTEFPSLEGTTLTGEAMNLPHDALGRPAILVIGFSKAAAKSSRGWLEGCRSAVAAKSSSTVSCIDVRMLVGVPKLFRGSIEHSMRNGYPVELQRQTLLVYTQSDDWNERVKGIDDKMAYVIGCDRDGRVRGTATGAFVQAELKRILDLIEPKPGSP